MNIADIDGKSDNYLAEIRRISAINHEGRNPTHGDENFERSRSRSRSPMDFNGQQDPFRGNYARRRGSKNMEDSISQPIAKKGHMARSKSPDM